MGGIEPMILGTIFSYFYSELLLPWSLGIFLYFFILNCFKPMNLCEIVYKSHGTLSFFLSFFISIYYHSKWSEPAFIKWLSLLFCKLFQNGPWRGRAPRSFFPRGKAGIFRKYPWKTRNAANFPEISVSKDNSRNFTFLDVPVHRRECFSRTEECIKNRGSAGINVPVSTWEFSLLWRVIFQREASFGSLFVTVHSTMQQIIQEVNKPRIYAWPLLHSQKRR